MGRFALILTALVVFVAPSQASPWRIVKDHWSAADEQGYEKFVTAIGETNCSSSESCLRTAANPYRNTDQAFIDIDVDCAKWPYLLRAYYAWKNGLPFGYVNKISGEDGDLRYTRTSNHVVSRHDIVDAGNGADAPAEIKVMLASVFTGTARMDASDSRGLPSDSYSPAIQPGSIRPGTVLYDANGHVGVVYKIDEDGRIYYMDAHPDFTISRSVYGAQFGQAPMQLGGGFKNWRPLQLIGAHRDAQGHLLGGHMVAAPNSQIADYSLAQYTGTGATPADDPKNATFRYKGIRLGAAMSGGRMTYNPIYELKATMQSLCNDLHDRAQTIDLAIQDGIANKPHPDRLPNNIYGSDDPEWESYATPSRDARLRATLAQFDKDMAQMVQMWINRDPRIVYDGNFLKQDLQDAYAEESKSCTLTYLSSGKKPISLTLDEMIHRISRMSFDPYNCVELRWGADGDELSACGDGREKRKWYEAEQPFRNETVAAPNGHVTAALSNHAREAAADARPPVDVKLLIDNMSDQVPFQGMAAVGR
jgi:hypothetical protein